MSEVKVRDKFWLFSSPAHDDDIFLFPLCHCLCSDICIRHCYVCCNAETGRCCAGGEYVLEERIVSVRSLDDDLGLLELS